MTREIRSRRAGLSRDAARQQPLYSRLLGLQYVTPNGFLCFIFFEGAVALGILLALAELVSWWGVLVLPVTVALMVKLNDVVAGAVVRTPSTVTRPARTPASTSASRDSAAASRDSAAASRDSAAASRDSAAAIRMSVSTSHTSASRTAASAARSWTGSTPADQGFSAASTQSDTRTMPAALPSVRRAAVRPAAAAPSGEHPGVVPPTTTGVRAADIDGTPRDPGIASAGTRVAADTTAGGSHSSVGRLVQAMPDATADANALNGPPVARHWDAPTERLDSPVRWARQAASRRYQ